MRLVKAYIKAVDRLNDWVGRVFGYAVLLCVALVVFEVITRRFFNSPTLWSFEIIIMIYGFYIMMMGGYGLLNNSIVSVDIVSAKLPERTQKILTVITYLLLFFPFVVPTFFASVDFAAASWLSNERSWSVWAPVIYPFKTVVPVALFLLLIQGVSQFLKALVYVVKGEKL